MGQGAGRSGAGAAGRRLKRELESFAFRASVEKVVSQAAGDKGAAAAWPKGTEPVRRAFTSRPLREDLGK